MKKNVLLTLLIFWIQTGICQLAFDKGKLDNYFNTLEENNKFMGSVAVSKNGKVIYSKSIGYADITGKIKASENTKYRIGSISKTFTAVLVFKAVEDNKLDETSTIDKWFPTISNADKITIKQLLSHRSGIHSITDNPDYLTWNTQPKTRKEMIEIISKGGSDFEPNSKAIYSNSNFILLTYILEEIYSKSFNDLLHEYIVSPVGLTNTYVFGKIDPNNNESKSYKFLDGWKLEAETDGTIPMGAGAIISTPSDLIKFSEALFSHQLLTAESFEKMKTIKDGYGMGLFQIPFYDQIGFGHTGGIDGFSSVFTYFDDQKISYALTSNGTNFNNNDISIAVLSAIFGKAYKIPVFTQYELNSKDLDTYLGIYTSKQIPLKIAITKNGSILIAQGTGQPALPLTATEKNIFTSDQVKAKFIFNPAEKSMLLFQGGVKIVFAKEEK